MKLKNDTVSSVFLMPKSILDYFGKANKTELKLIIYLFSLGDTEFSEKSAAELLKVSEADITSALSFWRGTGILLADDELREPIHNAASEPTLKQEEAPKYTSSDIAKAMETDDFATLVDYAQRKLGRLFNQTETALLYGLYDYICLPKDMIVGIIEYCNSIDKTSMRYIEKTAIAMYDDGIRNFKNRALSGERKQNESAVEKIKKIIGAENRALTKSEKLHITKWMDQWEVEENLIALAYERTINNIGKPSVSYMSKIIEGWITSGVKTVADAENMKNQSAGKQGELINLEDFIEKPDGR